MLREGKKFPVTGITIQSPCTPVVKQLDKNKYSQQTNLPVRLSVSVSQSVSQMCLCVCPFIRQSVVKVITF